MWQSSNVNLSLRDSNIVRRSPRSMPIGPPPLHNWTPRHRRFAAAVSSSEQAHSPLRFWAVAPNEAQVPAPALMAASAVLRAVKVPRASRSWFSRRLARRARLSAETQRGFRRPGAAWHRGQPPLPGQYTSCQNSTPATRYRCS